MVMSKLAIVQFHGGIFYTPDHSVLLFVSGDRSRATLHMFGDTSLQSLVLHDFDEMGRGRNYHGRASAHTLTHQKLIAVVS